MSTNNTPSLTYEYYTGSEKFNVKYIWTIQHYSFHRDDELLTSSTFSGPGGIYEWYLQISQCDPNKPLSLYLNTYRESIEKFGPVSGKVLIQLINSEGKKCEPHLQKFYLEEEMEPSVHIPDCITQRSLYDTQLKYLQHGELKIYCEFAFILLRSITNIPKQCPNIRADTHERILGFEKLYNDQKTSDVEIYVNNDEKYVAHKFVLISSSPVFEAMFTHDMKETRNNRIDIKDISEECLVEMLRFMYTGKVENLETTVFELFLAADKYNIDALNKVCENEMFKVLSAETAAKIVLFSHAHGLQDLKTRAYQCIRFNSEKVMQSEGWNDFISRPDLVKDAFLSIIKS